MQAITFRPLYMERVWGGRELERIYHRHLPNPDHPYGEAWEIVDRQDAQSVVEDGPLAGMTLHDLWNQHREPIFGSGYESFGDRFPLLIKILDARDDLSIQVHPPIAVAPALGGEPKTEMWYIADCNPGAKLYAGLRRGVSRAAFEQAVSQGTVAECVHAISPQPGESIFIPSGRLHAIGAGFLIHEIQQNSDTTYRVFDWNRLGLDGKPRELHVAESLASIDFDDFEPTMDCPNAGVLASCEFFKTMLRTIPIGGNIGNLNESRFSIVTVTHGSLLSAEGRRFETGCSLLLPKGADPLHAEVDTTVLKITVPMRNPA
jgi:mannose-6-phosphate isomerase